MSFSIQTNVNSLVAQQNLNVNSQFQSRTIQRLTSGFRINSSGDDAAGLAIANKYRTDTAELTQGVRNANDGISQLQTIDGGLSNITTIIDRLRTLATQSASATFTGDRNTLNNEYQSLLSEITRQASNINLNAGGSANANLTIYTGGGGASQANAQLSVDLSGAKNQVDAAGLGLANTSVVGSGSNVVTLGGPDLRSGAYLATGTQTLTFQTSTSTLNVTIGNGSSAITGSEALASLNSQISSLGITASADSTTGQLSFSGGSNAFTVSVAAPSAGTDGIATTSATGYNNTLNRLAGSTTLAATPLGAADTINFVINGATTTVSLASGATLAQAQTQINGALAGKGVFAVENAAQTGLEFQGVTSFTATETAATGAGVLATGGGATNTATAPAASVSATGNALSALTSLSAAIASIGLTQGLVGSGENKLQYAVNLAQSQISSFSSAQSQIRDADIAAEAANLTKAQVLQQSSIAALAQANSSPQAILKLLQ